MLILYIALGSFALGGGIILASNLLETPSKQRRYYRR